MHSTCEALLRHDATNRHIHYRDSHCIKDYQPCFRSFLCSKSSGDHHFYFLCAARAEASLDKVVYFCCHGPEDLRSRKQRHAQRKRMSAWERCNLGNL
jgi:hypothetical protein